MSSETVLERSFRFERGSCEIHVMQQTSSQGEEMFRAAAYRLEDGTHELQIVTDDSGVPYEVLSSSPATAAERLADKLELRFGPRLSGPDQPSDSDRDR